MWYIYVHCMYMYCIAGNFCVVQNFAFFADRSASAKIKTVKIATSAISIALRLPARTGAAKISSGAIQRNFAPAKISHYTLL